MKIGIKKGEITTERIQLNNKIVKVINLNKIIKVILIGLGIYIIISNYVDLSVFKIGRLERRLIMVEEQAENLKKDFYIIGNTVISYRDFIERLAQDFPDKMQKNIVNYVLTQDSTPNQVGIIINGKEIPKEIRSWFVSNMSSVIYDSSDNIETARKNGFLIETKYK